MKKNPKQGPADKNGSGEHSSTLARRLRIGGILEKHIAPRLDGKHRESIFRTARRLKSCGEYFLTKGKNSSKQVLTLRTCKVSLACPDCAKLRAKELARKDSGLAAVLLSRFPEARFLFVTLTPWESENLRGQVDDLQDLVRKLWTRKVAPFDRALGLIAQIHIGTGRGGGWRAHTHIIFALQGEWDGPVSSWFLNHIGAAMQDITLSEDLGSRVKWDAQDFSNVDQSGPFNLASLGLHPVSEVRRRSRYSAENKKLAPHHAAEAIQLLQHAKLRIPYGAFRDIDQTEIDEALKEFDSLEHGMLKDCAPPCGKEMPLKLPPNTSPRFLEWKAKREEQKAKLIEQLRTALIAKVLLQDMLPP